MSSLLERLPIRRFLGASIHAVTLEQATQICREAIVSRNCLMVGVVNVAKIVKMRSDSWLRESVLGSDLIVADGLPIVWASRLLGEPLPERVTGIDLFEKLLELETPERAQYVRVIVAELNRISIAETPVSIGVGRGDVNQVDLRVLRGCATTI